jgi:hypothetical protein
MSMRFWFRNGSSLLCALFAISLGGCQDSTGDIDDVGLAVELNSNVIRGTIEFTNTNPEILAILHGPGQVPSGADDGLRYIMAQTRSTNVSPPFNNHSDFAVQIPPNTRTRVAYEVTNEAGEAGSGIIYAVNVDAYLDDNNRDYYRFVPATAAPLERAPAPPVTLDFRECAGVIDIRWQDVDGDPVVVRSGSMVARFLAPGGIRDLQSYASFPGGTSRERLVVRGGMHYYLSMTYATGNDPTFDLIRHPYEGEVTIACDEIVEVIVVVPEGGGHFGAIVGQIDMLGESEHASTFMQAFSGPFDNSRLDYLSFTPSQGQFTLENLVPSGSVSPARGYAVNSGMFFSHNGLYQSFGPPFLDGTNGRVMVSAGQTVDLGDTFVIDPGFVGGDIYLAGPQPGPHGSCLQAMDVPRDPDGNGIPSTFNSRVIATGSSQRVGNATFSAYGASAGAAFDVDFDASPSILGFVGYYEMALGGLRREVSRWQTGGLQAFFQRTSTPSIPLSYQQTMVQLTDQRSAATVDVVPGQTTERPIHHCFGQLNLAYSSSEAQFYNPRTSGSGTFSGSDFEGNPASYAVQMYAHGTPLSNAPGTEGMVVMCLPQGTYNLTPTVTGVNPNGTTTEVQLPALTSVEVGCREVKTITPELSMHLEATPVCTAEDTLVLTGDVDSQGGRTVSSITAAVNGDDPVSVCTDCGVDPSFSTEVALRVCENRVLVRAEDDANGVAEIERRVTRDRRAPSLGCHDITVEADPALGGAYVDYAIQASDDCTPNIGALCDVPSGSFFALGQSTSVTCRSTDRCGKETTCSFAVHVEGDASCENPDPREQDYWRTQCNYRGVDGSPPDPTWGAEEFQALIDGIQPDVQAVCDASESTCQALNPDPYWDICEQACQQYTAVLLNIASDLLPAACCTLEGSAGLVATRLATMIATGQCEEAVDIAYELNRGCLFCEDGH